MNTILRRIYIKIYYILFEKKDGRSSESDNGIYINRVNKFLNNDKSFENFKRDPLYSTILEHLSKGQGSEYLDWIKNFDPTLYKNLYEKKITNDLVGNPIKYSFNGIKASPNTLRYIKIASEIKLLFGDDIGNHIIEIGGGYGGQLVQIDSSFKLKSYTICDLEPVNKLIEKYVEKVKIKCELKTRTLNDIENKVFDFLISNYAFSELEKEIQLKYLQIIKKSKRGYMIMNSGDGGVYDYKERLTKKYLLSQIPNSKVINESPCSYNKNYVIIWGL